jgi:hypothetical protein
MESEMSDNDIRPPRIASSLLLGALAGTLSMIAAGAVTSALTEGLSALFVGIMFAFWVFLFAYPVWLIGLFMFGLGPWIVLHRMGHRSWRAAIALGFAITFLIGMAASTHFFGLTAPPLTRERASEYVGDSGGKSEIAYRLTPHGWKNAIVASAIFSASGVLVALTVWLAAYRPWQKDHPEDVF